MLMKTYVDQIARENKKLEDGLNEDLANGGTLMTDSYDTIEDIRRGITRRNPTLSTMVTIRNNEGKVCNTKQVSKLFKKTKTQIKKKKTIVKSE